MKRCIDSGLWVPNAKGDDGEEKGDEKDDEPTYEEIQHEKEEAKKEWPHLNCDLFLFFGRCNYPTVSQLHYVYV